MTKVSKAAAATKVRIAYYMNEQNYPMSTDQLRLRVVLTKDAARVRKTGTYRREC